MDSSAFENLTLSEIVIAKSQSAPTFADTKTAWEKLDDRDRLSSLTSLSDFVSEYPSSVADVRRVTSNWASEDDLDPAQLDQAFKADIHFAAKNWYLIRRRLEAGALVACSSTASDKVIKDMWGTIKEVNGHRLEELGSYVVALQRGDQTIGFVKQFIGWWRASIGDDNSRLTILDHGGDPTDETIEDLRTLKVKLEAVKEWMFTNEEANDAILKLGILSMRLNALHTESPEQAEGLSDGESWVVTSSVHGEEGKSAT